MKTLSKTLMVAALLAVPFAAAQASTAHERWIEAQKIDIKPTISVTETQIPADSVNGVQNQGSTVPAPGTYTPSNGSAAPGTMPAPGTYMPSTPSPNTTNTPMPPSGTYTPQGNTPIYTQPGVK